MSEETLAEREAREWREWINGPSPSLHNVPWQKIPMTAKEVREFYENLTWPNAKFPGWGSLGEPVEEP